MYKETWVIPTKPRPKGRPRLGRRGRTYTPEATAIYQAKARALSRPYAPCRPFKGACSVRLVFAFAVPKSWPKWKRTAAHAGQLDHASGCDVDNLSKAILDALNGLIWADDRQVHSLHAIKAWAPHDGVWCFVREEAPAPRRAR